jgi:hypothetical protein
VLGFLIAGAISFARFNLCVLAAVALAGELAL